MAAHREGPGQETGAGRQVEHAEVRSEVYPRQYIAVLREQMVLDDGIEGRHPVEEALGARSLSAKLLG